MLWKIKKDFYLYLYLIYYINKLNYVKEKGKHTDKEVAGNNKKISNLEYSNEFIMLIRILKR